MDFIGAYTPSHLTFLLEGFWITLQVAFLSIIFSFAIAIVVGVLRYARIPVFSRILATLVELVRNLPLLLIIFFTYFALPEVGIKLDKFYAAVLALVIFEAAMLSEIVRSGLNSVEKGQIEAARSSGLNYVQTLWHVVLPQALRRMVPPIHVYSSLSDETVELAMFTPTSDISATLEELKKTYGEKMTVAVLPLGPLTIPYVEE